MELKQIHELHLNFSRLLGNWWQDDRRKCCAYCGIPMRIRCGKGKPIPPTKATKDHVIPKAHRGSGLTIPACRECNSARGKLSLQEYLGSAHFSEKRKHRHRNQWPLHVLSPVWCLEVRKNQEVLLIGKSAVEHIKPAKQPAP